MTSFTFENRIHSIEILQEDIIKKYIIISVKHKKGSNLFIKKNQKV